MAPRDAAKADSRTGRALFITATVLAAVSVGLHIASGDPNWTVIASLIALITVFAVIRYGMSTGRAHAR